MIISLKKLRYKEVKRICKVPRDDRAACTREQVALLFIVSTGPLNHDFEQVNYCPVK